VYFYVKTESAAGAWQPSYLTTGAATTRAYTFPTSFSVSRTTVFIEGADAERLPITRMISVDAVGITATPPDTIASATFAVSYNTTASLTGAVSSSTGAIGSDGNAAQKLLFNPGGTSGVTAYYLFARVTAPGGASFRDIACTTPIKTILSPLCPSTATSTGPGSFGDYYGADYATFGKLGLLGWFPTVYNCDNGYHNTSGYLVSQFENLVMSGGGYRFVYTAMNTWGGFYSAGFGAAQTSAGYSTFSFSWRYRIPIAIRRFVLTFPYNWSNTTWPVLDPTVEFTITGYTDSGSIVASTVVSQKIIGSSIYPSKYVWVSVDNPVACEFYRFKQTAGPLTGGDRFALILGN
jgi:hypothetical protein